MGRSIINILLAFAVVAIVAVSSQTYGTASLSGFKDSDCSVPESGSPICLPTDICFPTTQNGQTFYIDMFASQSKFKIGIYQDSSCSYELGNLELLGGPDSCAPLTVTVLGQTKPSPPDFFSYDIGGCALQTGIPKEIGPAAELLVRNIRVVQDAMQYPGSYTSPAVFGLFALGLAAGGFIGYAAFQSKQKYESLPSAASMDASYHATSSL
jgi:hypothetical protein